MEVRQETAADHRAIETVTRDAFWNLYEPGATEHYIVHALRDRPEYLSHLCLIAEVDGQLVGSIITTRSHVVAGDGKRTPVLTIGPVSVLPERQGQGIGRALVEAVADAALGLGEKAICLLGYPAYYERFGFRNAHAYGITMGGGLQPWAFQVLELAPGALREVSGTYEQSSAFEPDLAAVATFDAGFPPRERFITRSQKAFQAAVGLVHGAATPPEVTRDARSVVRADLDTI